MRWGNGLLCSFSVMGSQQTEETHLRNLPLEKQWQAWNFSSTLEQGGLCRDPYTQGPLCCCLHLFSSPSHKEGSRGPGPSQNKYLTSHPQLREGTMKNLWKLSFSWCLTRREKQSETQREEDPEVWTPLFPQQHSSCPLISLPQRFNMGRWEPAEGKKLHRRNVWTGLEFFTWTEENFKDHRWKRGWVPATHVLFSCSCKN